MPDSGVRNCNCGKCADIKISDQKDYLCCNQMFSWKDLITDGEKNRIYSCVTQTEAYISSVNPFAVKGMSP